MAHHGSGVSDRIMLAWYTDMEPVAQRMMDNSPDFYDVLPIEWGTFPDTTPNVMIKDAIQVRHRHVLLLCSFRHMESWMAQLGVIYALPRYLANSVTVVLPFYPTGTMERVDYEGQVATAMTLSRILSVTPTTYHGPVKFVVYDIHALQTRFYFHDGVLPCLLSAMPLFLGLLRTRYKDEKITICYPDDGARKRFSTFFKDFPLVVCSKMREGDQRLLKVTEGDPAGCHCMVVDDLVQSGGTLTECKKELEARGAAKVSAFVTHGVFPDDSWRNFIDAGWAKFFLTDTIPDLAAKVNGQGPFEVITVAADLNEFVKRFHRST